jgi:hypothetical protein
MAALVAAIPVCEAAAFPIGMAGTRPAMTQKMALSQFGLSQRVHAHCTTPTFILA